MAVPSGRRKEKRDPRATWEKKRGVNGTGKDGSSGNEKKGR